jgi:hypothetical protein
MWGLFQNPFSIPRPWVGQKTHAPPTATLNSEELCVRHLWPTATVTTLVSPIFIANRDMTAESRFQGCEAIASL